jgi:hypothetical protein
MASALPDRPAPPGCIEQPINVRSSAATVDLRVSFAVRIVPRRRPTSPDEDICVLLMTS